MDAYALQILGECNLLLRAKNRDHLCGFIDMGKYVESLALYTDTTVGSIESWYDELICGQKLHGAIYRPSARRVRHLDQYMKLLSISMNVYIINHDPAAADQEASSGVVSTRIVLVFERHTAL